VIFGPVSILLKQLQRVLVVVKVVKQGLEPLVFMEAVNKKSCVFCGVVLAMADGGMGCWVAKSER
jgi:ribosomal protein S27E